MADTLNLGLESRREVAHGGLSPTAEHAPTNSLALHEIVKGVEITSSPEGAKGPNIVVATVESPFSSANASPAPTYGQPTVTNEVAQFYGDPQTSVAHTLESVFTLAVTNSMKGD